MQILSGVEMLLSLNLIYHLTNKKFLKYKFSKVIYSLVLQYDCQSFHFANSS